MEIARLKTMNLNSKCNQDPSKRILIEGWAKIRDVRNVNWSENSAKLKRAVKKLYAADNNQACFMRLCADGVLT